MKKTTTKKTTKADLTRAREIADVLGVLSQFIPRVDGSSSISPLFSHEFLLKDLIGLTQEEYDRNEDLLKKECGNILEVLKSLVPQESAEAISAAQAKKSKKSKEKVN